MHSVKRNTDIVNSKLLSVRSVRSNIFVVFALSIFIFIVFRTAWVSDDAYITFRTIDNWIHGYGLTWNAYERVQVYTHPLWMLLISGFYFLTHEMYYTSVFVSIVVTSMAVALFAFGIARTKSLACFGVLVFAFSRAFVDYSTSGLENPLTHLILGLFLFVYLKSEPSFRVVFLLSLIGGLGMLNRLDTSLLFMPVIFQSACEIPRLRALAAVVFGFLPFLIWEIFSLIYYGFLIPNTAYAKLEVGISRIELVKQGTYYFWNSLQWDLLTLVVVATSIALCLVTKNKRHRYAVLGVALYLIYVLLIGGDFMSGRYFSAPVFVAVIILATSNIGLTIRQMLAVFGATILIGTISLKPPIISGAGYGTGEPGRLEGALVGTFDNHGIADERAYYYKYSGLLNARAGLEMPSSPLVEKGRLQSLKHKPAVAWSNIGFFGFFAGPEVYIIDRYAISNPLLARLPINTNSTNSLTGTHWRIGHIPRKLPDGYIESLSTGKNRIVDVETSELYDTLVLITKGDIFDHARLEAIWKINSRWLGW